MGCDIHVYREKRVGGKWVSADEWEESLDSRKDVPWEKQFHERNYDLFSVLAQVRQREEPEFSFPPRGIPVSCSEEVSNVCADDGLYGHSHSYLYLHELQDLADRMKANVQTISGMKRADEVYALQKSIESGNPDWDFLYPYCQSTNAKDYIEFSFDVPADFIIGNALNRIIESLASIGGEQQRIVFWFDN